MKVYSKTIFQLIFITSILSSCNLQDVDGISIGHTLYENQSFSKNLELKELINRTLNKEEKALASLIDFPNGGAAGSYDLGFIITQIMYKIGEKDFMDMINKLDSDKINNLEGLIMVGLEYGDNDKDSKTDNKKIESEFPQVQALIRFKNQK